jgi:predicted deacetylase
MTLNASKLLSKILNVILDNEQELVMINGNVVQMVSHDGRWYRSPTVIIQTIRKVDTGEYEIHMIHDRVVEIIARMPDATDAFIKHKFLSATMGLKQTN